MLPLAHLSFFLFTVYLAIWIQVEKTFSVFDFTLPFVNTLELRFEKHAFVVRTGQKTFLSAYKEILKKQKLSQLHFLLFEKNLCWQKYPLPDPARSNAPIVSAEISVHYPFSYWMKKVCIPGIRVLNEMAVASVRC